MKTTKITTRLWIVLAMALTAHQVRGGGVYRAFFDNFGAGTPGDTIQDLISASDFLRNGGSYPEFLSEHFDNVQGGINSDDFLDNFGSITRGYLEAPLTGTYTIFLATDDNGELYLGTNHTIFPFRDPAFLIAFETNRTAGDIYSDPGLAERSATVDLVKGQKYFVELLHKEGVGDSFVRVAWQRPDGVREIIPGRSLAPYGSSFDHTDEAVGIEITGQPQGQSVEEGQSVMLVATFFAKQPTTLQWLRNGQPITDANLSWLSFQPTVADNGAEYSLRITDGDGLSTVTSPAFLSVSPETVSPTLLGAHGSGNPQGLVVDFSEPVEAASATAIQNYQISGQTLSISSIQMLTPSQALLKVNQYNTTPITVTVSNVRDLSAAQNVIVPGSQVQVTFRSRLMGYWDFNAGSGTAVPDASGHPHHGTLMGAGEWQVDVPTLGRPNPYALYFNGFDAFVNTAYPGVSGARARTISCWIKSIDTNNNHGLVAWGRDAAGRRYHFRLNNTAANGTVGGLRTEVNGGHNTATQMVADNQWHHVVSVLPDLPNPTVHDVLHYVDGVLDPFSNQGTAQAIDTDTDLSDPTTYPVTIGRRITGGAQNEFYYTGLIDDVAIYDLALTPEQITNLWTGTDPRALVAPLAGPLTITVQPTNRTVLELGSVTFVVAATGSDPDLMGYQWTRNGVPIPGATNASYTINPVPTSDHLASFRAQVFNLDGTFAQVTSAAATLTVNPDLAAPKVVSIRGIAGGINKVIVDFDEPLDQSSATNLSNYDIPGLTILSASLDATGSTLTLRTTPQTVGETNTLTLSVIDRSAAQNRLDRTVTFVPNITYAEEVLEDGPMRYWRFGETSDVIAYSETSVLDTAKDGTYVNGVDLTAPSLVLNSPGNTAAGFSSGNNQRVDIPNGDDININQGPWREKTIELWFEATAMPAPGTTARNAVVGLYEQGSGTRGLGLYLWRDPANNNPDEGVLIFTGHNNSSDGSGAPWGVAASSPELAVFASYPVQVRTVYHVVAVMDGDAASFPPYNGQMILYVNGVEVARATGAGLLYSATGDVQIGRGNLRIHTAESGNLQYFDGTIDEVALYNQALASDRVLAHYTTGMTPSVPETDFEAPQVLAIRGVGDGANRITITFDEPLLYGPAVNVNSYQIAGVTVESARLDESGAVVTLVTSDLLTGNAYDLSIAGIKDLSSVANQISTNINFTAEQATYADQVLADGAMRYWRLGETNGSLVAVSEVSVLDTGASKDGDYVNSPILEVPSLLRSETNTAAAFSSVAGSRIGLPDGADVNTPGSWSEKTIELWFRADAMPIHNAADPLDSAKGLYSQGGGDGGLDLYLWRDPANPDPDQALLVFTGNNNDDDGPGSPWGADANAPELSVYVTHPVTVRQTYHVVAVMNGSTDVIPGTTNFTGEFILYVNGQEVARTDGVGFLYNHGTNPQIARGNGRLHTSEAGNHEVFDGVLDEIALYNTILSPQRILAHYQTGITPRVPETDLTPPQVVGLRGIGDGVNRIQVTFDEPVDYGAAVNIANYQLTGGTVLGAQLDAAGTMVTLLTDTLQTGVSYSLTINGVIDLSSVSNAVNTTQPFDAVPATYVDQVLADNPVRYWRVSETEGATAMSETTAYDVDRNGTYVNGVGLGLPSLLRGTPENPSVMLDSSLAQAIEIPDGADINTLVVEYAKKTVELWFLATGLPAPGTTGLQATKALYGQGGTTRGLALYLWRDPANSNPDEAVLVFHAYDEAPPGTLPPWGLIDDDGATPRPAIYVSHPVLANQVYHVVGVMDGSTQTNEFGELLGELVLYVNGQEVGRAGGVGTLNNHTGDAEIGGTDNFNAHTTQVGDADGDLGNFEGVLDELALYNTILSPERVAAHYLAGVATNAAPRLVGVIPTPGSGNNLAANGITIILEDGLNPVDPGSLVMMFNGTPVIPTVVQQGSLWLVTYMPPIYAGGTTQTVSLTWGGLPAVYEWSYLAMNVLPAEWATPLGSGVDRGFAVRTEQADVNAGLTNSTVRAEAQLADPPNPTSIFSGSGVFQVINFNQDTNGNSGVFRLDTGYPDLSLQEAGLMSLDHNDQIAMEIIAYLEFPVAGVYQMGANTDDGFRVTSGPTPQDKALELGIHEGGRGANTDDPQTPFQFLVTQPGIYPFRMIWYEGNGAASVEWSIKDQSGVSHLLNDTGSPVLAYRSVGTARPMLGFGLDQGLFTITWEPPEGTLQSAPTVLGPWTNVTTVTNIHTTTPGDREFFRVVK